MSDRLVITFASERTAKQGCDKLLSMEKDNRFAVDDAVVAVKTVDGTIKLSQLSQPAAFWGIRAAASGYPNPLGPGALTDFGTNDKFVKDVAEGMPSGAAAVFVLVSKITTEKVLEELRGLGGKLLRTSFDKSAAEAIRASLAA